MKNTNEMLKKASKAFLEELMTPHSDKLEEDFSKIKDTSNSSLVNTIIKKSIHDIEKAIDMSEGEHGIVLNNLGVLYYKGFGMERNFEKAVECFTNAAALGHKVAVFNLGFCFERGEGVPKDLNKAFECYKKSWDKDFPVVNWNLAFFHELGLGSAKKDSMLVDSYCFAADHANVPRQKNPEIPFTMFWENSNFNASAELSFKGSHSLLDPRYLIHFRNPSQNHFCSKYNNYPKIYKAAFEGDLKIFEECLKQLSAGEIRTMKLETGETPLVMAVLGCSPQIIERLLDLDCDPNLGSYEKTRLGHLGCIHLAMHLGTNNILKLLLRKGANPNPKLDLNVTHTPLDIAIMAGDNSASEFVPTILDAGANIDAVNNDGATSLISAVYSNHQDVVQVLCDRNADVNIKDKEGNTALSIACSNGYTKCAEILLEKENCKFDLFSDKNGDYISPLGMAIENNNDVLVEIILKSKAFLKNPDLTAKYSSNNNSNYSSKEKDALEDFRAMLQNKIANAVPLCHISAISLAVELGRTKLIPILLKSSTQLQNDLNPKFNKNCLRVAIEKGFYEIVKLLIPHFDVNQQDEFGKTYLHYLIEGAPEKGVEIASLLVQHNANPMLKDNHKASPINLYCKIRDKHNPGLAENFLGHNGIYYKIKNVYRDGIAQVLFYFTFCSKIEFGIQNKKFNLHENEKSKIAIALIAASKFLLLRPNLSSKNQLLLAVEGFSFEVISKSLRRNLSKYITITDDVIDRIIHYIIDHNLIAKEPEEITEKEFLTIVWNCSDEKINIEKSLIEKKSQQENTALKNKRNEMDNILYWMPDKLRKYFDEVVKLKVGRQQITNIMKNIKELSESLNAGLEDFATKKLKRAENILFEVTNSSDKLLEQEISFNFVYKKLAPKIKEFIKENNFKQATKLLKPLLNIKNRIEKLGTSFKESFQIFRDIENELQEQVNKEKHIRFIQQQRGERKNTKEQEYIQLCLQKLTEAESKLKELQSACQERINIKAKSGKLKNKEINEKQNENKDQKAEIQKNRKQKETVSKERSQQHKQSLSFVQIQDNKLNNEQELLMLARDKEVKKIIEKQKQEQMQKQKQLEKESQNQGNKQIKLLSFDQQKNYMKPGINIKPEDSEEFKKLHDRLLEDRASGNKIISNSNQKMLTNFMDFIDNESLELDKIEFELGVDRNISKHNFSQNDENERAILNDFDIRNNQSIKLKDFDIEPKLKARDELTKLKELIEVIAFLKFERTPIIFRMERAAILGIIARAMECYKNISMNTIKTHDRKNNVFKILAKIFRDTVFHPNDDKLFKNPTDDAKINAELNRPYIDMACKLLSFLNDPKWKNQTITFDDIMQTFKDDLFVSILSSATSKLTHSKQQAGLKTDLFTKLKRVVNTEKPSASFCRVQILNSWAEITEFEMLKENVPDIMRIAAIGFNIARIGCFAAELIKPANSDAGTKENRMVFNELRRIYKIPLGIFIQQGICFRHVLKKLNFNFKMNNKESLCL